MGLIDILIMLGIFQGLFLGIALLCIPRGNRRANIVLGILTITFSISILDILLYRSDLYQQWPYLMEVGLPVILLFGPLFLLYVTILTTNRYQFKPLHLLHLIPFLSVVAWKIPFYLLTSAEKLQSFDTWYNQVTVAGYIISTAHVVSLFVYLHVINRMLKRHQRNIREEYSSLERINLAWIRTIQQGFYAIFGVIACFMVIYALGLYRGEVQWANDVVGLMVCYFIYLMGYSGLRQPEIFIGNSGEEDAGKKYEKSTLQPDMVDIYVRKLHDIIGDKKPFTDSGLTLHQLAQMAAIPSYHLSQILNERLGQNFYDFINRHRIDEAKRRMVAPEHEHLTILAIANDVGFNSKSAFNTAFKKYTNTTPSQFRKSILELAN
jgi:AraC-like DNA-binding protein